MENLHNMPSLGSEAAREIVSVFRGRSVFRSSYTFEAGGAFTVGAEGTLTVKRGEAPRESVTVKVTGVGCTVTPAQYSDGPDKPLAENLTVTPSAKSFTVTHTETVDGKEYTVGSYSGTASPAQDFDPSTIEPTAGEVTEPFEKITLTFKSKPTIVTNTATTTKEGVTGTIAAGDSNTVDITLSEQVTSETGEITVTVAAGSITNADGSHCNKELTYTYTVQASEAV